MKIQELKIKTIDAKTARNSKFDDPTKVHLPSNPDIGPHENKEINLMINAGKTVALLSPDKFVKFKKEIAANNFVVVKFTIKDKPYYLIGQPGHESELNMAKELFKRRDSGEISRTRFHISLGKLLGYTNDQIRQFLGRISEITS